MFYFGNSKQKSAIQLGTILANAEKYDMLVQNSTVIA